MLSLLFTGTLLSLLQLLLFLRVFLFHLLRLLLVTLFRLLLPALIGMLAFELPIFLFLTLLEFLVVFLFLRVQLVLLLLIFLVLLRVSCIRRRGALVRRELVRMRSRTRTRDVASASVATLCIPPSGIATPGIAFVVKRARLSRRQHSAFVKCSGFRSSSNRRFAMVF